METATLNKAEGAQIERMAESFSEPTMEERFKEWAPRVASHEKQEKKEREERYAPQEISMKGRTEEEKDFIEKAGQRDESTKEPQKDAARAEQRSEAKESKPDARADEKSGSESTNSPSEPLSGERHWQNDVAPDEKELNDFRSRVNSRAEVALEYINQHPEKAQIVQGLRGLTADRGQAFESDLHKSLAEVPNPGEVLRHLGLVPVDREALRNAKDWKELRAAIKTISKHYAASSPQASPKPPRAPKPPSEVGGRGAAGDDGAVDFTEFSSRMNQRFAQHAR